MDLTDMLFGHRELERRGYSPTVIRSVLSSRVFGTVAEMIAALDEAQASEEVPQVERIERLKEGE